MEALRHDARRRVVGERAIGPPGLAPGDEVGIRHALAAGFDHEVSIAAHGVGGLVPLGLLVPHEPRFERPVLRVEGTVAVELVRPHEVVALRRCRLARPLSPLSPLSDEESCQGTRADDDQEERSEADLHRDIRCASNRSLSTYLVAARWGRQLFCSFRRHSSTFSGRPQFW